MLEVGGAPQDAQGQSPGRGRFVDIVNAVRILAARLSNGEDVGSRPTKRQL